MSFMKATATYRPRNTAGQFIDSKIVPGVRASVQAATQLIYDESQALVPVATGDLKASGKQDIAETDKTVVGRVMYTAPHAPFVEFGTGRRGAASDGAGDGPYDPNWPGMVAQPYLRPALDTTRAAVKEAFASNVAIGLR